MLRLDYDQYDEAAAKMAKALNQAETAGMRTFLGRALCMLEALGNDFDVAPMDPGPRFESDTDLANRAFGLS